MIIVYYKDRVTGEIKNAHVPRPDDMCMHDLVPIIAKYNDEGHPSVAAARQVADDSLEAYLFKGMIERRRYDKERVQDAIDAIRTALDCVSDLED